jgi:uracil-DNA glycosylase
MPAGGRSLAVARAALGAVREEIVRCHDCPRLRRYCARIAVEKRAAYRDEVYWGRPVPGFGDPAARLLLVGLAPAAHGANRTGRVFTGDGVGGSGDFLLAALHANGFANLPTSRHVDDGLVLRDAYVLSAVRCAPPDNKPTPDEIARCRRHLTASGWWWRSARSGTTPTWRTWRRRSASAPARAPPSATAAKRGSATGCRCSWAATIRAARTPTRASSRRL